MGSPRLPNVVALDIEFYRGGDCIYVHRLELPMIQFISMYADAQLFRIVRVTQGPRGRGRTGSIYFPAFAHQQRTSMIHG